MAVRVSVSEWSIAQRSTELTTVEQARQSLFRNQYNRETNCPEDPMGHFNSTMPDPDARSANGKAARKLLPRTQQGSIEFPENRRDPVDILITQSESRVQELIPLRYGRMAVSPFTFYRGAAAIMAEDLGRQPHSGLRTQLCGDAHLANFGVYSSPERRLVFDVNDFDETNPGPFEWDVKRLVASFAVAGRHRGFSPDERSTITKAVATAYRNAMLVFATMRNLDVWYAHAEMEQALEMFTSTATDKRSKRKDIAKLEKFREKAKGRTSLQAFTKMTVSTDGLPEFRSQPPLLIPVRDLMTPEQSDKVWDMLHGGLNAYQRTLADDRKHLLNQFKVVDLAHKVVGVGSVGLRAWVVLLLGRDLDDPLVLQIKQSQQSVLEPYSGRSKYRNHGQRVVNGQRLQQAFTDIFLGWTRVTGLDGQVRDFYVRQLRDGKGSADLDRMPASAMEVYARLCGWTVARAHARAGDRIAIASYLGSGDVFEQAMNKFAEAYADQNERDYELLLKAIADGRIEAASDVQ
jgi:uncharacterized protein (DUF2252 family)